MREHINILLLTLFGLLAACSFSERYPDAMQNAIRCMEQHPDSAQLYLTSLESSIRHEPKETRMYYALLKLRTDDLLKKRHTTDSLAVQLVNYYKQTCQREKLLEAYYLLGRIYRNMGDAPRSLAAFQEALSIGKTTTCYNLMARIYEHQNYLYAYQDLYPEAMEAAIHSRHYYQLIHHDLGIAFSYRNQARIFDKLGELDSMEYYYQKSYEMAKENSNPLFKTYILEEQISAYIDHGMIEKGEVLLSKIHPEERTNHKIALYNYGMIHAFHHQNDSAISYFKRAIPHNDLYINKDSYRAWAQIEAEKKNFSAAYEMLLHGWACYDSIVKRIQTEALAKAHALYNYQHIEKEKYQLEQVSHKRLFLLYGLVAIILLVLALTFIIIQRLRHKKQQALAQERLLRMIQAEELKKSLHYIEEKENKLQGLEKQLDEQDSYYRQLLDLQRKELELSKQQATLILSNRQQQMSGLISSAIYQHFHQAEANVAKITESDWLELQQTLDLTYPQFSERLQQLYPKMSERERRICYLIKISMPNNQMALILCCTPSTITQTRKRLYKKITGEEGRGEKLDRIIIDL